MLKLETIQSVIFDMDGVLWRGSEPLPGVPAIFDFLKKKVIPYVFATNNSARTPKMYVKKLGEFGINAKENQIVTSAIATANYCRNEYPGALSAYILGGDGLIEAFKAQGFEINNGHQADLVVVGIDRDLTYQKLHRASYHIQGGAAFIGTNPDKSFPEPNGFAPGAGSILAALEAATNVTPTVVGKPFIPMFEAAAQILGSEPEHTLMIGDRLETDIEGANHAGLKSILVLSGVSNEADVARSTVKPDAVFDNLAAVLEMWQA